MTTLSSTTLFRIALPCCLILAANHGIPPLSAQTPPPAGGVAGGLAYADQADLAAAATMIATGEIRQVTALPPARAGAVPQGFRRLYVEARISGLIRGDGGISPTVSYLYDAPLDARGKLPRLKKRRVLLFARPASQPGQIQLVARDAQIDWTPEAEAAVRAIVSELLAPDAAPRIASVGDAFHVAGTVAGEGETQIFLRTDGGAPVSLSVISRPGQPPRWAVALGEIVDEAAATPRRGTLLWYRLACGLPATLPPASVRTLSVIDAEAARRDYGVVLAGLGSCGRTRAVP